MGMAAGDVDRRGIDHAEPLVVFVGTHDAEERMGGVRRSLHFPAACPHRERYSGRKRRGHREQHVPAPRIGPAAVSELHRRARCVEVVAAAGVDQLWLAPVACGSPPRDAELAAGRQAHVAGRQLESQVHGRACDHTGRAAQDRTAGAAGALRGRHLGEVMQAA